MELFWCIIWAAACYLYADDTLKKCPGIDINPVLYIIGGAIFGVFSFIYCWYKKRQYMKYNK